MKLEWEGDEKRKRRTHKISMNPPKAPGSSQVSELTCFIPTTAQNIFGPESTHQNMDELGFF